MQIFSGKFWQRKFKKVSWNINHHDQPQWLHSWNIKFGLIYTDKKSVIEHKADINHTLLSVSLGAGKGMLKLLWCSLTQVIRKGSVNKYWVSGNRNTIHCRQGGSHVDVSQKSKNKLATRSRCTTFSIHVISSSDNCTSVTAFCTLTSVMNLLSIQSEPYSSLYFCSSRTECILLKGLTMGVGLRWRQSFNHHMTLVRPLI